MNIQSYITPAAAPEGFMFDATGNLIRIENVPADKRQADEIVRRFIPQAVAINRQLAELKTELSNVIPEFIAALAKEHGIKKMSRIKGNIELTSFDGTLKLARTMRDKVQVNANIEAARQLFFQYLNVATSGVDDALKKLVGRAFGGGKENQISVSRLIDIKNTDINHPLWTQAVKALEDALEVHDTASYYLFYYRSENGEYRPITLQFSAVELDPFLFGAQ